MRLMKIFALCLAFLLPQFASTQAVAATSAEVAGEVRTNWAKAREAYLASVKPYQATNAAQIRQYTAALDKAGVSLEKFLSLKLATPAPAPTTLTAAVDQLAKDLIVLRTLSGKTTGPLATALGAALSQHNQIVQTALANMR